MKNSDLCKEATVQTHFSPHHHFVVDKKRKKKTGHVVNTVYVNVTFNPEHIQRPQYCCWPLWHAHSLTNVLLNTVWLYYFFSTAGGLGLWVNVVWWIQTQHVYLHLPINHSGSLTSAHVLLLYEHNYRHILACGLTVIHFYNSSLQSLCPTTPTNVVSNIEFTSSKRRPAELLTVFH